MPQAIIFDLWETVADKNFSVSKALTEELGIQREEGFLKRYEQAIQLTDYDTPRALAKDFLDAFAIPHTEQRLTRIQETIKRVEEEATIIDGMQELLAQLAQQHRLGLLSNTTCFESEAVNRLGLDKHFDTQTYSWQTGTLKPDPRSYAQATKALKTPPQETLFIDNNQANVKAARDAGLTGIHFRDAKQLREDLYRTLS